MWVNLSTSGRVKKESRHNDGRNPSSECRFCRFLNFGDVVYLIYGHFDLSHETIHSPAAA